MKIEVGKYYVTEDGVTVGPMTALHGHEDALGVLYAEYLGMTRAFFIDSGKRQYDGVRGDIIAKYQAPKPIPVITETVTTQRIISGQYGIVSVDADRPTGNPRIIVSAVPTATELTEAIETLTAIRDALQSR